MITTARTEVEILLERLDQWAARVAIPVLEGVAIDAMRRATGANLETRNLIAAIETGSVTPATLLEAISTRQQDARDRLILAAHRHDLAEFSQARGALLTLYDLQAAYASGRI